MTDIPANAAVSANTNKPAEPYQSAALKPNTNLEDVSDWLTKIIIGVSLVQAEDIAGAVHSFSQEVGTAVLKVNGALGVETTYAAFSSFCIVYFFVAGLYFGYLWTRLRLQTAIKWSDATLGPDLEDKMQNIATNVANTIATDVAKTAVVTAVDKRTAQEEADLKAQEAFDEATAVDFDVDAANQSNLTQVFKNASEAKRNEIFRLFRAARKRRGQDAEWGSEGLQAHTSDDDEFMRPISALLPIIGGLIGADEELSQNEGDGIPRYHANFAQRAYVYLKMDPVQHEMAIEDLNEAIDIRERQFAKKPEAMPHSLLFYELILAKTYLHWGRDVFGDQDKYADEIRENLSRIMATGWGQKKLERSRNAELADWWNRNMAN